MSDTNSTASPGGLPLALIVVGAVALILALTMPAVTGASWWRWVTVGGSVLQFVGWVLLGRRISRLRGGAR